MIEANIERILGEISSTDLVLDVGGWAKPFNRSNYVIDMQPYEGRGMLGQVGSGAEKFTQETWTVQDICGPEPFPFEDKMFDYVICSHTLEDCRDPIFACSEISRISKRGYIEVPSRCVETALGVESKEYCGCSHHRWLVDIEEEELVFLMKPHMMHRHWKYHLPRSHMETLKEIDKVSFLFWEGQLQCRENILAQNEELIENLVSFVEAQHAYPPIRYALDSMRESLKRSSFGEYVRKLRG